MAMTRDEAYRKYTETMNKLNKDYKEARAKAKATLNAELKAIQIELHKELKAVRAIQQKNGR